MTEPDPNPPTGAGSQAGREPGIRSILMAHPGAEMYGSDRVFLESATALDAGGWNVTVALPNPGPLAEELAVRGIRVVVAPGVVLRKSSLRPSGLVGLLLGLLRTIPSQWRAIRHGDYDVVYVSTLTIPTWLLLARILGPTTVCHIHEAETSTPALVRLLLALPLLAAHRVVFNSDFSRDVVSSSVGLIRRRGEVILNPVEGPRSPRPARSEPAPPVRLLYVGRLSERKGPQVAIRSIEVLRRAGTEARLDLFGSAFAGNEPFEADLLREVEDLGLDEHVTFHGFVADVRPAMEASDIVVVPSILDESFGNAAVEGVLAARPVVVSRSGGLAEAVRGYPSARSFEVGNASALSDAVQDMLDDWPRVRSEAVHDAEVARLRHGTGRYARELDGSMREAAARRDAARRRRTSR